MTGQISNLKSQIFSSRPRNAGSRRAAFTLVEVLVVIAIIGLLIGLLVPAVGAAKRAARRAAIKGEMTQIISAMEKFRTEVGGGQYPPDGTNQADMQRFCKAAWTRAAWGGAVQYPPCAGTGTQSGTVGPDTALIFWLCGAQDASGAFIGFSANAANPFDASRQPPRPSLMIQNGRSTDTTRASTTAARFLLPAGAVPESFGTSSNTSRPTARTSLPPAPTSTSSRSAPRILGQF